ncbi:MAG: hypothetical protein ACTS73_09140 [Arsenophonus sp. NEOnobi-MAG3]
MPLIKPSMFLCFVRKIFREVSCNDEKIGERLRRPAGILRISVSALGINKNDESD